MPVDAHASLVVLAAELQAMQTMIGSIDKRIMAQHRSSEASQRLESIPGIGVTGAAAITATVPDPKVFRSGRDFAAWIGLVPRKTRPAASTGSGRSRNGAIAICDAFWWSEPVRCCATRASSRRSIRGSRSFLLANRSRWWRWRLPTRWRASPGRCWPGATYGRLCSWQRHKGSGDGKMRLRLCVYELQG